MIFDEFTKTFQVSTNHIYLTKLMGFEEGECKRMLIAHPELYMQKFEDHLQVGLA